MKIALVADTHPPFHDPRAVHLACKLIEAFKPDELVHLGDGIDFYAVSSFDKNPERVDKLQQEIDAAVSVNKLLSSAAGDASCYYLEGNHDQRWLRYLYRHPEVSQLEVLRFSNLLKLEESGWQLGGEEREYFAQRLVVKHGNRVSKHSAYSARYALEQHHFQQSVAVGHTHRQGYHVVTGPRLMVAGWEIGCLCSLEPEYTRHPNWQLGLAFVSGGSGHSFAVELVPFITAGKARRAIWRGEEYTA
jgi:predicted phosphodiesterase